MSHQIFPIEIVKNTTENHFIQNNKPFYRVYLGAIILLIGLIVSIPLVYVDITSQSRGVIKTRAENNPIQTATYGLVEYSRLTEGLNVNKGDTLLLLNTDNINEQINQINKSISDNKNFITDLKALINNNEKIKTAKYQQELIQYQSKKEEFNIKLKILKKEFDVAEYLYHEKVTAEMEFLQKKSNYETLLAEKNLFEKQSMNSWQSEKTNLELEDEKLSSDVKKLIKDKNQYVVTSPSSGTIYQTKGVQTGSFLTPGQTIAYISPDEEMIAECYVSPTEIGFIRLNQPVNFQVDAFNYNQWGLIIGEVISISEDIIIMDNTPVFKIQCHLSKKYLTLKSGYKGNLKKGMTLTGRFFLNERTLLQLLYDKMDDWLNPKTNLLSNL